MDGTVIILGYRKGIVDACRLLGYTPLIFSEKKKPGLDAEKHFIVASLENIIDIASCIMTLPEEKIVGVITGHEQGVFSAAVLRNILKLPGDIDHRMALRYRDKYLQKRALDESVMKPVVFYYDKTYNDYDVTVKKAGSPFIIKPSKGNSALNTHKVLRKEEWNAITAELNGDIALQYVIESFSEGNEYFCDGCFHKGELKWFSIGMYLSPLITKKSGTTPAYIFLKPDEHGALYQLFRPFIESSIQALGKPHAVFHLECFYDGSCLRFGECAARPAGGFIPEALHMMYGFDLYDCHVKLSLGIDDIKLPCILPARNFGIILFQPPGSGSCTLTEADFRKNFNLSEIKYENININTAHSSVARIGHCILSGDNADKLTADIRKIISFSECGYGQ